MRNCVIWSVLLLAMVDAAFSKDPKPSGQEKAKQEVDAGGKTEGPSKELTVELGGGVKMDLVLIPAGEFMMGDDQGRINEKPVHKVNITKPFYLGKYEVTQEQWEAVMGSNPSRFKGPKNPADMVIWDDCQAFIAKLNKESRPGSAKFGLPTEAQWEYACRAGTTTRYSFGDDPAKLDDYAWWANNAKGTTHPVGQKKPNAWGLYDMAGNVCEWCADRFDGEYYAKSPTDAPAGPGSGASRVLRGGSWNYDITDVFRSAHRSFNDPDYRRYDHGFRVARTLTP